MRALFHLAFVALLGASALGSSVARAISGQLSAAAKPGLAAARGITLAVGRALVDAPPKRRYVVAAIGDSLTDPRVGGAIYLSELRRRCPESQFDAYGVGGQRTGHMRWRASRDLFGRAGSNKPAYSHVVVLGGVNDLAAGSIFDAGIESVQRNLKSIYLQARSRGIRVVAMTLSPWTGLAGIRDQRTIATRHLNRWIMGQVDEGTVDHAIDIHELLECSGKLCPRYRRFADDLVHWSPSGHAVVAAAMHAEVFSDCS